MRQFERSLCRLVISVQSVVLAFALPFALPARAESDWKMSNDAGEKYLTEQKLPEAEASFRQALKEVEHGSHSLDEVATCLSKLADTLALRNETAEAQSLYQRCLTVLEREYGKGSVKVVPALFALGSIYEAEGDPSSAMALYERALHINEKDYGPYSPAVANSLHRLGRASYRAGDRDQAKKHYKLALSILLQQPGLDASNQLQSLLSDYADLLKHDDASNKDLISDFQKDVMQSKMDQQAPANSQPQLRGSAWQQQNASQPYASKTSQTDEAPKVVLRGMKQPLSSSELAPAYHTVDNTIYKQSHYEKGEQYYQRMIAVDEKALGPNHPALANDLNELGLFYISQQRFKEAEPLLMSALSIYEKVYGADNILTIKTGASLAFIDYHLGRIEQAAALYRTALSYGQDALGPNNLETARILNELAYLYYHQGKLQESCTFYQWALASTQGALGEHDPLVAACMKDYAQVLRSLGRTAEADAMEARADDILAKR